jgi:hypothetical protein
VLFDPRFAGRVWSARAAPTSAALERSEPAKALLQAEAKAPDGTPQALQLLSLLQREGRLVDFLEQDITSFSDEEVGAAARLVHDGCRKTLRQVVTVTPVRAENEGTNVTIPDSAGTEVKLIGNVGGTPPYRGTLRHRGWRASAVRLPQMMEGHDAKILAPAEVEL